MFDNLKLDAVAQLLQLIANPPNVRSQPQPGDTAGPFTQWFDGGAVSRVGDYAICEFAGGSRAAVLPSASLVVLDLADGRHVLIQLATLPVIAPSSSPELETSVVPPTILQPGVCPRCGHVNGADAQYCADCGGMLSTPLMTSVVTPLVVPPAVPVTAVPTAPSDVQPVVSAIPAPTTVDTFAGVGGVCVKCGTSNKTGARFCRTCGTQLA